jgi:hypothetical protein
MPEWMLPDDRDPGPSNPAPTPPCPWDHIDVLSAECAEWFPGVAAWPAQLRSLTLKHVPNMAHAPPWPPTLRSLSLGGIARLRTLPPFPTGLQELTLITCWGLEALPPLPEGLERLALYDPRNLKRLPAFGPALRKVFFGECRQLELDADQLDRLDALQARQERGEAGVKVSGFAMPGEVRENLRSRELDGAVRRVYAMAAMAEPHADAEFWKRETAVWGAGAEPLGSLLYRMWSEHSSGRGGVRTIARDMVPILEAIARHPALLPHAIAAAAHTPGGCINQPVLTWRRVAALAAAHEAVVQASTPVAALQAAGPLLANIAIDEAAATALGEVRQTWADEAQFAASEPEVANRLWQRVDAQRRSGGKAPLPGVPRDVAYVSPELEAVVDTYCPRALATVAAVMDVPAATAMAYMNAPPDEQKDLTDPVNMLCRGPYADWWQRHLIRIVPGARFDLGPNGQIEAICARKLAQFDERFPAAPSEYVPKEQREAAENLLAERREKVAAALETHTRRGLAPPISRGQVRPTGPGKCR